MNTTPLISIVIPIYNVESYLLKCLDSVVNQTYKNLEILLIDDGSPDNSGAVCDEYALRDKRVTVIHQQNQGLPAARNTGIAASNGKWICFVDSDDWMDVSAIELLVDFGENNNLDVVICNYVREEQNKQLSNQSLYKFGENTVFSASEIELLQLSVFNKLYAKRRDGFYFDCNRTVWNHLYKRELITDNNMSFNVNCKVAEDTLFNLYLYSHAKHIGFLNKELYHQRILADSNTKKNRNDAVAVFAEAVNQFKKFSAYKRTDDKRYEQWEYLMIIYFLNWLTKNHVIRDNSKGARKRLSEIKTALRSEPFENALLCIDKSGLSMKGRLKLFLYRENIVLLYVLLKVLNVLNVTP